MKRSTILMVSGIIAIVLLAVAIIAKSWIFYLFIGCLVFGVSMLGKKTKR